MIGHGRDDAGETTTSTSPSSVSWARVLRAGSLSILLLPVVACGRGDTSVGRVSGTVTYQGKPVTVGFINFLDPSRGMAAQGRIDDSGSFTLEGGLEAGTYRVYLQPPLPDQLPPGTAAAPVQYDIPWRFQDPVQTPMTQDVRAGSNTLVIEFPDDKAPAP